MIRTTSNDDFSPLTGADMSKIADAIRNLVDTYRAAGIKDGTESYLDLARWYERKAAVSQ